jgi:hypothetical protein
MRNGQQFVQSLRYPLTGCRQFDILQFDPGWKKTLQNLT